MKSLIVGCSSTHGSETASPVYDIANTKHSWANLLSTQLGYEPDNQAIPGNSNQAIFHLAMEKLQDYDLLIVGWSGLARESWVHNNKNYFFNARWACCVDDISLNDIYVKESCESTVVSDQEHLLKTLDIHRRFLIEHKFDLDQMRRKVYHYRTCLQTMCKSLGVRYIDANIIEKIFHDVPSLILGRHPDIQEHQQFAALMQTALE
jgi:hypothetical protein